MKVVITGGAGFIGQNLARAHFDNRNYPMAQAAANSAAKLAHPMPGDFQRRLRQALAEEQP